MSQFIDTRGERFPDTSHTNPNKSWIYTIAPFMESVDSIRICPDDRKGKERFEQKLTSYVMNAYADWNSKIMDRYFVRTRDLLRWPCIFSR